MRNLKYTIMVAVSLLVTSQVAESLDLATSLYLASQSLDIWEEYDQSFYQALTAQNYVGTNVRKFYYIGITLPDLLDSSAQEGVREGLDYLYQYRDTVFYWVVYGTLTGPLYILDQTHNQVQTLIKFNGNPPNTNLSKLKEMVEYAKSHNWSPLDKSLIYGAYMHVIQDLYGHMVLQPSRYGYGYAIESDSVINDQILWLGEQYHEMFTGTHIDSPNFGSFMWPMYARLGPALDWETGYYEFFSEIDVQGRYMPEGNWQNLDFEAVEKFVEAAQSVNYATPSLTRERLEAYMHGWAILLFMIYGYRKPGTSEMGAIVGHPAWSFHDVKDFLVDQMDDFVSVDLTLPPALDVVIHWIAELLGVNPGYSVAEKAFGRMPFPAGIGLPASLNCLAEHSGAWTSYFETPEGLDVIWSCVPDSNRTEKNINYYYKWRRELEFLQDYGEIKKPNLRSSYKDELDLALSLEPLMKLSLLQGADYLDYQMGNRDIWSISRKAGILGGLYLIPDTTYYQQPGVFDLNFAQDGNLVYTPQTIPLEGVPDITINLNYDLVTFGGTKVLVKGYVNGGPPVKLDTTVLTGPDRKTGSLDFNAQDAVNEGADTVFFEVQTKNTQPPFNFTTMFQSDYRGPYFSHSEIHTNAYYDTFFVSGNPVRTQSQNPVSDPAHYWPYILPLKDTLTVLNAPSNFSATSDAPWTSVNLSWQDNSNYETGYEIMRDGEVIDTTPPNATSYSDSGVSPFSQYLYQIRAISVPYGASSSIVPKHAYTGPAPSDSLGTAYNNSQKIVYTGRKLHMVYRGNQNHLYYLGRSLSSNNYHEVELSTMPIDVPWPNIIGKDSLLAVFLRGSDRNPRDLCITWSSDNGDIWRSCTIRHFLQGESALNLSATFGETSDTIFLAFHDADNGGSWIVLAKLVMLGSLWDLVDSTFYPLNVDSASDVTGPAISYVGGHALIVWSVKDSLYYGGTFLCEGERPSLAGDYLVYQDGENIYLREYTSDALPHWSDAQYVASGDWPYVTCKESKVYVFYKGNDGLYVSYGTFGESDWHSVELESENGSYISGIVLNKTNMWVEDTATPEVRMAEGNLIEVRRAEIWVYYLYTKPLTNGYGLVFGEKDLGPITFSGGPQEAGLKPQGFRFMGIMPNPSSGRVNLAMYLPEKTSMRLKVYDVTGRAVLRKIFRGIGPGRIDLPIETARLSSGIYFYQVELNNKEYLGKFSVLR